MMSKTIKKIFYIFAAFIVITTFSNNVGIASDYKYKVLDPRYNPHAEELLQSQEEFYDAMPLESESTTVDYKMFFALLAMIFFPISVFSLSFMAFRKPEKKKSKMDIGNIKIERKSDTEIVKSHLDKSFEQMEQEKSEVAVKSDIVELSVENKEQDNLDNNKEQSIENVEEVSQIVESATVSEVIETIPPKTIYSYPLADGKGLSLLQQDGIYSLVGYIDDKTFELNKFEEISAKEIRPRLSESTPERDRYIVRLGNYKALVEVSDKNMKLLLEL